MGGRIGGGKRRLGATGLEVHPLCLGGNVFGWTADERTSFEILDEYVAAGGNFIDTADVYSAWAPGNVGGESEAILGRWMATRRNRRQLVVATKVGMHAAHTGLGGASIQAAVEASLRRLQTDFIDVYYAHVDDPATPLEETVRAFDRLVREGKVRHLGASNYSAARLDAALSLARLDGAARFAVLQPEYNLMVRAGYEGSLREVCLREGLACLPYWSLAKGFLTGKYRAGAPVESARAAGARTYEGPRGDRVLAALDDVASARGTTVAAVALAWLAAQPTVASVLASARTTAQLREILPMTDVALGPDELDALARASA